MKGRIEFDTAVRVIVDGKTTESFEIPANAPRYVEGTVLELRELGLVDTGVPAQPEPSGD
jgi:hypothetical protein